MALFDRCSFREASERDDRAGAPRQRVFGRASICRALLLTLLLGGAARDDVVQLAPSKDNTLYESDRPLSNGSGRHFFVGTTPSSGRRRALIAFDIAGSLPVGATVLSVTLRLHVSRERGNGLIELHRALANWGEGSSIAPRGEGVGAPAAEGDVTWLNPFWDCSGSPPTWKNPGGDFDPNVSASVPVGGIDFYTVDSTVRLVADAQLFLDSPEQNFGWVLTSQVEIGPLTDCL